MTPNLEQIEALLSSITQRIAIVRRLGQNAAAKLDCIQESSDPVVKQIAICLDLEREFIEEVAAEICLLSQSDGLQLSAAALGFQLPTGSFPR